MYIYLYGIYVYIHMFLKTVSKDPYTTSLVAVPYSGSEDGCELGFEGFIEFRV